MRHAACIVIARHPSTIVLLTLPHAGVKTEDCHSSCVQLGGEVLGSFEMRFKSKGDNVGVAYGMGLLIRQKLLFLMKFEIEYVCLQRPTKV